MHSPHVDRAEHDAGDGVMEAEAVPVIELDEVRVIEAEGVCVMELDAVRVTEADAVPVAVAVPVAEAAAAAGHWSGSPIAPTRRRAPPV